MNELKNLLHQVYLVYDKYEKIAEITGERYNIFNILGIETDELVHSKILANFFNIRGSHGQKDLFLKLFIQVIKEKKEESEKP